MSRDGLAVAVVLLLLLVGGPLVYWLNSGRDPVGEAQASGAALGAADGDAACAVQSYARASRLRTSDEGERDTVRAFAEACFAAAEPGAWCATRCDPEFSVGADCAPDAPHASPLCRDIAKISDRHCCGE